MAQSVNILVVEDEPKIRTALTDFLEFHDFKVKAVCDGLEAAGAVSRDKFDIVLLDLMLPHISGEELCRKWRAAGIGTPIIMLTAKGQEKDKIAGLDMGADDYITKPFSLEELLARIRAVMRRSTTGKDIGGEFEFGPWRVSMAAMEMQKGSERMEISPREGEILKFFACNAGRVISRSELYENVWQDSMGEIETRTVDMHIAKLRAKIETDTGEPEIIKTVRGVGYKYEGGK